MLLWLREGGLWTDTALELDCSREVSGVGVSVAARSIRVGFEDGVGLEREGPAVEASPRDDEGGGHFPRAIRRFCCSLNHFSISFSRKSAGAVMDWKAKGSPLETFLEPEEALPSLWDFRIILSFK
jgi:hypothetical protein